MVDDAPDQPQPTPTDDAALAQLAALLAPHLTPHLLALLTPAQIPRGYVNVLAVDDGFVLEHHDPTAEDGPTLSEPYATPDEAAAVSAEEHPGVPLYRTDVPAGIPTDPRPGVTHLVAAGPGRFYWIETNDGETVATSAESASYGQALDEARLHAEFHCQQLSDEVAKDGLV